MQETNKSKEQLLEEVSFLRNKVYQMEKNDELAQLILNKTSDNISITTFDFKAKYIYVSPSVKNILGYEPKDLLGKSFFDFIHPHDKLIILPLLKKYISSVLKRIIRIDDSSITEIIEFRFKNIKGQWRNMQSTVNFIGNNMLAITRDITAFKLTEIKNKRFSRIFEDSVNEIYLFDSITYKFTDVNKVAQQNMGYSLEKLRQMTPLDLNPNYTPESFEQRVAPLRKGIKDKIVFEAIHQRKDNSFYNVEVHLQMLKFEDVDLFAAIILDITDRIVIENKRKIAEETLQLTNARLNALIESPRDIIIFSLDRNYRYLAFNSNHEREMKKVYDADIMIGMNMLSFINKPEVKLIVEDNFKRVLKGESFEEEQQQPDLNIIYQFYWSPIIKESGEIIGISCLIVDITERKNAEIELNESEDKFRRLNDIAPVGIYYTDKHGNCTYANKLWLEVTGLKLEDALGYGWVNALHPEDKEMIQSSWYDSQSKRNSWELEYRFKTPSGKVSWVHGLADPFFDVNNELMGYVGVNLDITERKKNEEIISESQAKFKRIFDSKLMGILFWDYDGEITDANDTFLDMVGYSRDDLENNRIKWREMTPPEYYDQDVSMYKELSEKGYVDSPIEKEYFHKDGHRINITLGATTMENTKSNGIAFVLNIDDRKKNEVELSLYRDHLEEIVKERTRDLEMKNNELDSAMKVFVGREITIRNLQEKIRQLKGGKKT